MTQTVPEILAPAGDLDCLLAAIAAGADAVYFGVAGGFNARVRATNFQLEDLGDVMERLRGSGRRGYLALNTLVFDSEWPSLERLVDRAAKAGVDAVIVQDLGLMGWLRERVPSLRVHASTQMTCTDSSAVRLAASLGVSRVVLPREASLVELASIRADCPSVQLEVFVHGALCIAYSGQCLTSEAIGGRSANRGACAQACRLPYDLVVDGVVQSEPEARYLLSPGDLESSELLPELLSSGVDALKIEGRLKGPEYVTSAVLLYRKARDAALGLGEAPTALDRERAQQAFSRGSTRGFFEGVNHQTLVDGRTSDHTGPFLGNVAGERRTRQGGWVEVSLEASLALGDGIVILSRGSQAELGGRIWGLADQRGEVKSLAAGQSGWLWLGPERELPTGLVGRRVFRTSAPRLATAINSKSAPSGSLTSIDFQLTGELGARPTLSARVANGTLVSTVLGAALEPARQHPLSVALLEDKLGRLGGTPFSLGTVSMSVPDEVSLSPSALNQGRRELVTALLEEARTSHEVVTSVDVESLLAWPTQTPPSPGLFVLCRNLEQARAAVEAGAPGVYLDFLALSGTGDGVRELRAMGATSVGLASPRIRKPGDEKTERFLLGLAPDHWLVRSLGALSDLPQELRDSGKCIADFSLNTTNSLAAVRMLELGLAGFSPGYDLDSGQLVSLLDSPLAPFAEVVLFHPMPLFHMEHCVFAARLSDGKDHRSCGRPCETHEVRLKDRAGYEHPLDADVACRNTVFHAVSQSAAELVPRLLASSVRRFRLELLRETPTQVSALVTSHLALLAGQSSAEGMRRELKEQADLTVLRGSLRVLG